MNLSEFNYHARDKRAEFVWEHARFLCICYKGGCSIILYHIGEFFAEVWYSKADSSVVKVSGFKNTSNLEPCLEQISITSL